jgi:Zn-dependent protease with chaperone function
MESNGRKWWRRLACVVCLAALLGTLAAMSGQSICAQDQTNAQSSSTPQSAKQNTDQFRLSREKYEKAVAYSRAGYTLHFVLVGWGIVVLVLLLRQRVVARLRDFAEARSGKRIWQSFIFVPALVLLLAVLDLPLELYWHRLSLRYQQSIQGWGSWMWDWTKGELIGVVFALIAVWILFAVIRWKPRTWWLYFWFASIPLVLFVVLISPWVLDPMFHKFRPLQQTNPQLVESIVTLTNRAGVPIPRDRMFLMEASEKTNQINAYVTGIGASKRVVVWDNTIKKMTPDEVLFVVGHEMGHYALGHVVKGISFALAVILVGLYLACGALQWALRQWGEQWSVRGQEDWAALAVLLLISSVFGFFAEPIGNGFSRTQEHAADVYGLEVTHGILPDSQEAAAHAFQVMGELDLADPNPSRFITIWLYSHPPLVERLKFAHDYDPWGKGEAPKYVK